MLQAARSTAAGKVRAIFQPHLFSRTQLFAEEFAQALSTADDVVVLDIYPAREEPILGVSAELISNPLFSGEAAPEGALLSREEAVDHVCSAAESGDIILTLGAGDVTALGPEITAALQERSR